MKIYLFLYCALFWANLQGEDNPQKLGGGARQSGVGCAFFANIPALSREWGIDVEDGSQASKMLMKSIYGLRRGDFNYQRAFDRDLFFELFGMEAEKVRYDFLALRDSDRAVEARALIEREIWPALDRGCYVSLRVMGDMGKPHNLLLMGREGDGSILVHNPTIGKIRPWTLEKVGQAMVTPIKKGGRARKSYYSSFHVIAFSNEKIPAGKMIGAGSLKASLRIYPDAETWTEIAKKLHGKAEKEIIRDENEISDFVGNYPEIDFAVVKKGDVLVSAIGSKLEGEDLRGALNIAKMALMAYESGWRKSFPVLVLDGKPRILFMYQNNGLVFWNGEKESALTEKDFFKAFKDSGSMIGYVSLAGG